jgi:hypothetical protein
VNAIGPANYLVVHGRAPVTEGGAPELLQQLARRYLGPDVKFPPMPDPPPGSSCASRRSGSAASAPGIRVAPAGDRAPSKWRRPEFLRFSNIYAELESATARIR